MPGSGTPSGRTPWVRPPALRGCTTKHRTGCGSLYITVNQDEDGQPREILCRLGKAGGCAAAVLETASRLISVGLQNGVPLAELVSQCSGIRCYQHQGLILSCISHLGERLAAVAAEGGGAHEPD